MDDTQIADKIRQHRKASGLNPLSPSRLRRAVADMRRQLGLDLGPDVTGTEATLRADGDLVDSPATGPLYGRMARTVTRY